MAGTRNNPIDKRFIHFKNYSTFLTEINNELEYVEDKLLYGNIKRSSIVWISDKQLIWTHGKFYPLFDLKGFGDVVLTDDLVLKDDDTLIVALAKLNKRTENIEEKLGDSSFVTLDTEQTISGQKTFTSPETLFTYRAVVNGDYDSFDHCPNIMWHVPNRHYTKMLMDAYGNMHLLHGAATDLNSYRGLTVSSLAVHGGTANQFLKGNGSLDSTQYLYHRRTESNFNIDTINALGGGLYEVPDATGTLAFNKSYWHKIFDWGADDNGWRVQMCTALTSNQGIYFRHKLNGNWTGWTALIDSGNYAAFIGGQFVSKAGDTITGLLSIKKPSGNGNYNEGIRVHSCDSWSTIMLLGTDNTTDEASSAKSWGIFNNDGKFYITKNGSSTGSSILSNTDGTWRINEQTIWYAGNSTVLQHYTLNLQGYDSGTFYPVVWPTLYQSIDCEVWSQNVGGADPYNSNRIRFLFRSNGWSDDGFTFTMLARSNYDNNEITIGAIGRGNHNGWNGIWLRGGRVYYFRTNFIPKFNGDVIGSGNETFAPGPNLWGGSNGNVSIIWKNDSTRSSLDLSTISSNVASATKLQTARSLWGQAFDGTGDVSGGLSGVSSINFSAAEAVTMDQYGNISPKSTSDSNTWQVYKNGGCALAVTAASGKVGIGTYTPEELLHVMGNIKIGDNRLIGTRFSLGTHTHSGVSQGIELMDAAGNVYGAIAYYQDHFYIENYKGRVERAVLSFFDDGHSQLSGSLTVQGNINLSGDVIALSDRRVKSNIKSLYNRGYLIPRTYIKDNVESIGFIAQEVQEKYPELVKEGSDSLLALNYGGITAVLAAQIIEQQEEISELKQEVALLKSIIYGK